MEQVGLTNELMMDETARQHRNATKTRSESGGGDYASGRDPFLLGVTNSGKVTSVKQSPQPLNPSGDRNMKLQFPLLFGNRNSTFLDHSSTHVANSILSLFLPPSPVRNASLSILARSDPSCSLSRHGICYSSFS